MVRGGGCAISRHRFHRRRQRAAARSARGPGQRQLHRRARRRRPHRMGLGDRVVPAGSPVLPACRARHQRVQRHEQHDGHAAIHRDHPAAAGRRTRSTRPASRAMRSRRVFRRRPRSPTWICSRRPGFQSTSRSSTSMDRRTRFSSRTISGSSRRSGSTLPFAASRSGVTVPGTGAPRREPTSRIRTAPSGPRCSGSSTTSPARRYVPGSRFSRRH